MRTKEAAKWTKAQQGKKYHSTCGLSCSSRLDWKLPGFLIVWEINDEVFFLLFFSVLMIYLGSLAFQESISSQSHIPTTKGGFYKSVNCRDNLWYTNWYPNNNNWKDKNNFSMIRLCKVERYQSAITLKKFFKVTILY